MKTSRDMIEENAREQEIQARRRLQGYETPGVPNLDCRPGKIWFVEKLPDDAPIFLEDELLPSDPKARKGIPLASGVLDYFPSALIEIAKVSKAGNDQHNPGEPLHWARGKSMDQADTIMRHFLERGTIDPVDGLRHSAKLAWRALALLQLELEAAGAPVARGASEA